MTGLAERVAAIRSGAGLFPRPDRGVIEVGGSERVRWLDGMLTNDVTTLAQGDGCRALLLTRQGRITADLNVLCTDDAFWLELPRAAAGPVIERLEGFVIADDVTLADRSDDFERWSVEGGRLPPILPVPEAGGSCHAELAGQEVRVAAFSLTGLPGLQLFVPAGHGEAVARALREAGAGHGLVDGEPDAAECLRVEMGEPLMGRELDESVLPAEARLDAAVSETKGCYTGQEVVARMRSRGRANHLLVGLRFPGTPPAPGTELAHEGRRAGEVTSALDSPALGPIGIGYVKAELATPGARLRVDGGEAEAEVAPLPFAP